MQCAPATYLNTFLLLYKQDGWFDLWVHNLPTWCTYKWSYFELSKNVELYSKTYCQFFLVRLFFPISILYTLKFIFIKFIVVYLFWIYFNILQFMCEMTESFPCAIISAFRKPKNLLYVSLNIPVEVGDRYNYLYNIFFLAFRQFCLHFEHLNKMLSASSLWITTSILCRRKKKRKNMWIHSKYN